VKVDYQLHVRDLKIGPKRAWSRPAIACLGTINQTLEARSAKQAAPVRCKVSLKCCSFALRRCTPKQVSRLALRYDAQLHFELTNRASVRKAYSYVRRVDGRAAALNRREAPRERLCELRCALLRVSRSTSTHESSPRSTIISVTPVTRRCLSGRFSSWRCAVRARGVEEVRC